MIDKNSVSKTWLYGLLACLDPTSKIFRQPSLPENCAIVDVSNNTELFHAIFTGGFSLGTAQTDTIGFGVFQGETNSLKTYTCQFLKDLGPMNRPRYCHESVVLHSGLKDFTLLALGGKSGAKDWTNTCEKLDLSPFFYEGTQT